MIFPGLANPEPKIVAAPLTVTVDLDYPGQVSAPGYLFNMGGGELTWLATESADWLSLAPVSGSLSYGSYQKVEQIRFLQRLWAHRD